MTQIYNARGNIYAVASPQTLRALGIDMPLNPEEAASTYRSWAPQAISAVCSWPSGERPAGAKAHRSDGLLVGPFQQAAPFDLVIVNTDGTLAERSGNGLTIFAQSLTDNERVSPETPFTMRVHHDAIRSPTPVTVEPAHIDGVSGFWLDLGQPQFGPQAVEACGPNISSAVLNGRPVSCLKGLEQIRDKWTHSVLVRIGNPHCVTLLSDSHDLPGFDLLHVDPLLTALTHIAFAKGELGVGDPCRAGVNLQWACVAADNEIEARIFERGEGPTASSGTSASAVACAAWMIGWIKAGVVKVRMPGGIAPVRLLEQNGALQRVFLFGVAHKLDVV